LFNQSNFYLSNVLFINPVSTEQITFSLIQLPFQIESDRLALTLGVTDPESGRPWSGQPDFLSSVLHL